MNRLYVFKKGRAPLMVRQFHSKSLPKADPHSLFGTESSLFDNERRLNIGSSL